MRATSDVPWSNKFQTLIGFEVDLGNGVKQKFYISQPHIPINNNPGREKKIEELKQINEAVVNKLNS